MCFGGVKLGSYLCVHVRVCKYHVSTTVQEVVSNFTAIVIIMKIHNVTKLNWGMYEHAQKNYQYRYSFLITYYFCNIIKDTNYNLLYIINKLTAGSLQLGGALHSTPASPWCPQL